MLRKKFVDVPVHGVGAGLGDYVDDRPGIAAVFGIEGVGDHPEFFDRIGRWLDGRQVHEDIVTVSAVHHVVVGTATAAVHRHHPGIAAAVKQVRAQLRLHAGLELQELIGVAAGKRELADGDVVHHRANLGAGGFYLRGLRFDGNGFGGAADLQGERWRE